MDTILDDFLTVPEAAAEFGVTRQRMHQLIDYYKLEALYINARLRLIRKSELKKIPEIRPTGVHVDSR